MQNFELYGFAKVQTAFDARVSSLKGLTSEGEKVARVMAWRSFMDDAVKLDDSNELVANLARLKYSEALDIFALHGTRMDVESNNFVSSFFDELGVINRKVTKKSVQIVFYVFVALGLFGLYKLFT